MTFDHDEQSSFSDEEIRELCQEAIEQIKKVDAELSQQRKNLRTIADEKKKDIIRTLAKNLEGKIPTNTICKEVVNQLRDHASEGFIRKCLPLKYKDIRRSQNASQQNKQHSNTANVNIEKSTTDYGKSVEQEPKGMSDDEENEDDNLALQGALEQEEEDKEIEVNTEQEIPIPTADGQILIQRSKGNGNDSNNDEDASLTNANTFSPSLVEKTWEETAPQAREEYHEEEQLRVKYLDELEDKILKEKDPKVKIWMEIVLKREIKIFQLREALEKSHQFQTADKLSKINTEPPVRSKDVDGIKEDVAEFVEYKTYKEVSDFAIPFFRLGNSAKLPFTIRIDITNRKLLTLHLGTLDEFKRENG